MARLDPTLRNIRPDGKDGKLDTTSVVLPSTFLRRIRHSEPPQKAVRESREFTFCTSAIDEIKDETIVSEQYILRCGVSFIDTHSSVTGANEFALFCLPVPGFNIR